MTTGHGDWRRPSVTLDTFGGDTVATLKVIDPLGVETTIAVTASEANKVWTATDPYQFTSPGSWIERWTVTGTGKSEEDNEVLVAPRTTDLPTGQRVYATTADYAKILRTAPPAGARRALAEASAEIDQMLISSYYTVDVNGYPTNADVIKALRDATCHQAEYAKAIGDTNGTGANQYHSMSIATVSLTRGYSPAGSSAPTKWSAKAWEILQRAGLTGQEPATW